MIVHHLITVVVQTAPMIVLAIVLWLSSASRDVAIGWFGVAIGLILIQDFALTGFWGLLPPPEILGDWNWTGRLFALAAVLLIASLRWFGFDAVGFHIYQAEGSMWAWGAAAAVIVAVVAFVLILGGPGFQGSDTLIFQSVLVPAQEEFFYRGLLFYALDRAFLERRTYYGADLGPAALLTAVYFAGVYGIGRVHGGEGFEIKPPMIAVMLPAGLFLGWLRARTNSLLAPTLTRMAANAVLAI